MTKTTKTKQNHFLLFLSLRSSERTRRITLCDLINVVFPVPHTFSKVNRGNGHASFRFIDENSGRNATTRLMSDSPLFLAESEYRNECRTQLSAIDDCSAHTVSSSNKARACCLRSAQCGFRKQMFAFFTFH